MIHSPRLLGTLLLALAPLSTSIACSSGSTTGGSGGAGGGSGAVTTAEVEAACDKVGEREETCMKGDPAKATQDCKDFYPGFVDLVDPNGFRVFMSCLGSRACDVKDDDCSVEAGKARGASPTRTQYESACSTKNKECADAPDGFSDDYCFGSFLSDAFLKRQEACFTKPCEEIRDCLRKELPEG